MISIIQFAVDGPELEPEFRDRAATALRVLAARPGYVSGSVARSTDEPGRWVLLTQWRDVGSYRRALGAYEVKLHATPLLAQALDVPSGFEPLLVAEAGGVPIELGSDLA